MKQRSVLILLILLFFAVGNGTLYIMSRNFFLESYQHLDRDAGLQNMKRAAGALRTELRFIDGICADWAYWDDCYHFIKTGDPSFIASNIEKSIYENLRLNMIIFLDRHGGIVFAEGYDLEAFAACAVPPDVIADVRSDPDRWCSSQRYSQKSGFVCLPETTLMASIHPIRRTCRMGPTAGTLIMARYFTEREVERIAHTTRIPLTLSPPEKGVQRLSPESSGIGCITLTAVSDTESLGAIELHTMGGTPFARLTAMMTREVATHGAFIVSRYNLIVFLLSLTACTAFYFLSDRLFLWRDRQRETDTGYRALLDHIDLGIAFIDRSYTTGISNRVARKYIPCTGGGQPGCKCFECISETSAPCKNCPGTAAMLSGKTVTREMKGTRNGEEWWVRMSAFPVHVFGGNISGFAAIVENILDQKRTAEKIEFLSYYDGLTGLPNHALLMKKLETALKENRDSRMVSLLQIVISPVKDIYDTLGFDAGDRYILNIAKRLTKAAGDNSVVARIEPNQFAILQSLLEDTRHVVRSAEDVLAHLEAPVTAASNQIYTSAKIGIAVAPFDGTTAREILSHSDMALHAGNHASRNSYTFYSNQMRHAIQERQSLEAGIHRALREDEFFLLYQPQFDCDCNHIIGMEALIRWRHPAKGLISPARFVPIAEESGLILPVDQWVVHRACSHIKTWRAMGITGICTAVNLSGESFKREDIPALIMKELNMAGIPPQCLEVEITETALIENIDAAAAGLKRLKDTGVRIAMDDFGTGYSSLSYLQNLPVDRIKIDRSFISDITTTDADAAIVSAMIAIARNLNIEVLAEGVESLVQRDFLLHRGCRIMQGFFFARPMTVSDVTHLLQKNKSIPTPATT